MRPALRSCARACVLCALGALVAGALAPARADDDEARRARVTANRIEATWPLAGSGPVAAYLRKLGVKLGDEAGATPYPWRFVVVRDRSANAFAIGGGRIYVNEGVIAFCENEAEVAAILAHEMAHQLAGHLRAAPPQESRRDGAKVDLGAVTQELDPAKEIEADRGALKILVAAGYDPHAALSLALRQKAARGGTSSAPDDGRIESLRAALRDVPARGQLDSDAFRALHAQQSEGAR